MAVRQERLVRLADGVFMVVMQKLTDYDEWVDDYVAGFRVLRGVLTSDGTLGIKTLGVLLGILSDSSMDELGFSLHHFSQLMCLNGSVSLVDAVDEPYDIVN